MLDLLFVGALVLCCSYAILSGGRDGVRVSAMLILATLLSMAAARLDRAWGHTQYGVLAVDLLLLVGLIHIAMKTTVFWPLWLTAFHTLSVISHLATIAEPAFRPVVYFSLSAFWSLPGLLVMVAGIMLDRRASRRRFDGGGTST